ncbi:MAG: hypothetical protein RIT81_35145 [Deltaproteobacteria bacterium]
MRVWSLPLCFALLAPASAFGADWEEISHDEGIQVWQQPVEGTSLVRFRGKGKVEASIKKILAVLQDWKRKTEWMDSCVENRPVRFQGMGRRVVYNRTGSGVPLISDRDVVVQTSLKILQEERGVELYAKNTADKLAPEVDGVVRMPNLDLKWRLIAVSPDQTEVTYEVMADPGGSLPKWLVNLASKSIPHKTISNLRKQVHKDYTEELAYVEAAYDWAAVGL